MAICPKCGNEIKHLQNWQTGQMGYDMVITDGEAQYEGVDFEPNDEGNIWICPECYAELFTDEESAVKFLLDEWDLATEVLTETGNKRRYRMK